MPLSTFNCLTHSFSVYTMQKILAVIEQTAEPRDGCSGS